MALLATVSVATLVAMPVATRRCHVNGRSANVPTMPRPATGETFIARARVKRPKWDRLEAVADLLGTDRSKLINDFVDWALRERGAVLPERPQRAEVDAWLAERHGKSA